MSTATQVQQIQDVPLGMIFPSSTNPRSEFPEDYIYELAASIAKDGVMQNVIVRRRAATAEDVMRARSAGLKPKFGPGDDDAYELVIGECRLRASGVANKPTIPARICELSDEQVERMQIVENLKRRDLRPMDEATGYQRLLGRGLTLEDIANEIDKSISYVSSRACLVRLHPDGKELLRTGYLSAGHAILVARIPDEAGQGQALRVIYSDGYVDGKDKRPLPAIAQEWVDGSEKDFIEAHSVMSEKSLREWLKENINLALKKAPWKLDDAELYPEAGACVNCPHMSGNDEALFAELAADKKTCMKPSCYQEKKKRFIQIEMENAATINKPLQPISEKVSHAPLKEGAKTVKQGQWVEAKKGDCPDTKPGIFTDGEQAGQTRYICDNPKCKKHKHTVVQQVNSTYDPKQHEEENKKREEKLAHEDKVRTAVALKVLEGVTMLTDNILCGLVELVVERTNGYGNFRKKLTVSFSESGKYSEIKPKTAAFAKLAAALLLAQNPPWYEADRGRKEFYATVELLGGKADKLRAEAEKELFPEPVTDQRFSKALKTLKPKKEKKANTKRKRK